MILFNKKIPIPILIMCLYTFFALVANFSTAFYVSAMVLLIVAPLVCSADQTLGFYLYAVCLSGCFVSYDALFMIGTTLGLSLLTLKLIFLKLKTNSVSRKPLLCLLGFYLLEFIYGMCCKHSFYGILRFSNLLLCIVLFYLCKNSLNLKLLVKYLLIGVLTSFSLSFLYYTGLSTPKPFIGGSFLRFGGCFINVNSMAMYCSIGLAGSIVLGFLGHLTPKEWILYCGTFCLAGVATFSKTFFLITTLTALISYIYLFVHSEDRKKFALKSVAVVLILAIVLGVSYKFVALVVERFIGDGLSANGITTGRVEIWKAYFDSWSENARTILFGYGAFHPYLTMPISRSPHNTYLGLLTQIGIVGCLALAIIVIMLIKDSKLSPHIYVYLPLIVCLLNGLSEDYQNSIHTCLPILIALIFMVEKPNLSQGDNYDKNI